MTVVDQTHDGKVPIVGARWRRTKAIVARLLAAWAGVSFLVLFFARELFAWSIFGWPFSLYMVAQGLILFYVLLVVIYSLAMRRIENGTGEAR